MPRPIAGANRVGQEYEEDEVSIALVPWSRGVLARRAGRRSGRTWR
jgi:hypothetical protein